MTKSLCLQELFVGVLLKGVLRYFPKFTEKEKKLRWSLYFNEISGLQKSINHDLGGFFRGLFCGRWRSTLYLKLVRTVLDI